MLKDKKIKGGFSIGDLNGIGGELIVKTLQDKHLLELCTPIIYASSKMITFLGAHFEVPFRFNGIQKTQNALPSEINVLDVWTETVNITFGEPTREA